MHQMVRVNEKNYRKLHEIAGELQAALGHRVSLSDALDYLLHKKEKRARRFWRKIREKKALGRAGRGPRRSVESKKRQKVHSQLNLRPEVL